MKVKIETTDYMVLDDGETFSGVPNCTIVRASQEVEARHESELENGRIGYVMEDKATVHLDVEALVALYDYVKTHLPKGNKVLATLVKGV